MQSLTHKEELLKTFSDVRSLSFQAKKEAHNGEEKMNTFLDAINDFKAMLNLQNEKLSDIIVRLEKLTWFNNLDEDSMMLLNDLIAVAKDIHSSLIRQYVQMNNARMRGLANETIKEFKSEIDDLKETYQDLESVFFFLPDFPDFKETTKQLSLI
jgi:hypothetical protein